MSSETPIRRLRIEAFRGFRDAQEFDLDGSAIIVSGPNGTGKTSFFDAIQWCLVGALDRVASLRAKRTVEHIVNQYRLGEKASVEMELAIGSNAVNLRRTGDHAGSTLELQSSDGARLFGEDAEERLRSLLLLDGGPGLELALTTTGLMQQDVMRAMLQAKPADRYRHVSTVLGLGALEEFEDATKEAAKSAAQLAQTAAGEVARATASLATARDRLEALNDQRSRRPSVEALRDEIDDALAQLPPGLTGPSLSQPVSADELTALAAATSAAMTKVSEIGGEVRRITNSTSDLEDEPSDAELAEVSARLEVAIGADTAAQLAASNAQAILDAVERTASEVSRLAAVAIPHLSQVCPVCGQGIDRDAVEAELRTRAAETSSVLEATSALMAAQEAARDAASSHSAAVLDHRRILELRHRWDRYRNDQHALESALSDLAVPAEGFHFDGGPSNGLAERLARFTDALSSLRSRILTALDFMDDSAIAADLARASSEFGSYTEALQTRRKRADELARRAAQLKSLSEATIDARVEVTEQRFNAVQPLVADIFSRLDPHPAFKSIEFELNTYYKKGTTSPLVRDVVEDVTADPLVIFSTSQANIAALSYFLAMGWSAGDRSLPFVLLDDPVQSMDDVNVLGFADLSRFIRSSRQLVISTHERRFAGLLERKLAPRSPDEETIVFEFLGWDRSGPSITTRRVVPQLLEPRIRVVGIA